MVLHKIQRKLREFDTPLTYDRKADKDPFNKTKTFLKKKFDA